MSLKDKNDKFRNEAILADERLRSAYEMLLDQLGRAKTADHALKVGQKMPAFVLPNASARLVFSDDLLKRGPLVISFFRGNWCPYCLLNLEALEESLPDIVAAGGQLVALTPETGKSLAATKQMLSLSYEVLSDVDGAVGLQFGVLFRPPEGQYVLWPQFADEIPPRHGNRNFFLPLPATFIVDRKGVIRYTFVNVDFTQRAEPSEIVAVLKSLKAKA